MLVAAINQHGELHALRPAKINQLVHRRANRAPGVEHVVDQDDGARFDVAGQFGPAHDRLGAHRRQVVAI